MTTPTTLPINAVLHSMKPTNASKQINPMTAKPPAKYLIAIRLAYRNLRAGAIAALFKLRHYRDGRANNIGWTAFAFGTFRHHLPQRNYR